ncbi:hypothetical protein ACHAXS_004866 [Conticribra weissflogii]
MISSKMASIDTPLLKADNHNYFLATNDVKDLVQITGPHGMPVYAEGQLNDDDGIALDNIAVCPLSALRNIELWIGGLRRGGISESFDSGISASEFSSKGVITLYFYPRLCCHNSHPGTHLVHVTIGWTRDELKASGLDTDLDLMIDEGLLDYLVLDVAKGSIPTKVCRFTWISQVKSSFRRSSTT